MHIRPWIGMAMAVFVSTIATASPAFAQTELESSRPIHSKLRFLTVKQGDDEFASDKRLATEILSTVVQEPTEKSYGNIIDELVRLGHNREEQGCIARLTPYAFVVSEMRGAQLNLIATYSSKNTKSTTYNAYFVVHRDFVPGHKDVEPTLSQVTDELRRRSRRGARAGFHYHSIFSTSSYFLPSLYFRAQSIFNETKAETGSTRTTWDTIKVLQYGTGAGSSDLVHAVANAPDKALIASVWDGSRAKFVDLPPSRARGKVQLKGLLGTQVSKGARLKHADGREYEVETAAQFTTSALLVNVVAVLDGEAGNCDSGTVLLLSPPLPSVESSATVADSIAKPAVSDNERVGKQVWFIKVPGDLPCDLLVATSQVDHSVREDIRTRLAEAGPMEFPGDVGEWQPWEQDAAQPARTALSILRKKASAPPSPVVVTVRRGNKSDSKFDDKPVSDEEFEAVQRAIHLSGGELVLRTEDLLHDDKGKGYYESNDYYKKADIYWLLYRMHDGALKLKIEYQNFLLKEQGVVQSFTISYDKPDDLMRRVAVLAHSRMHRIRTVWPYNNIQPTVIRDVDFDVEEQAHLPLQEIEWIDTERNDYTESQDAVTTRDTTAVVSKSDSHDFSFEDSAGYFKHNKFEVDPMGRKAYRVLLMRPDDVPALFLALTAILVALFVFVPIGLLWDMRRIRQRSIPRAAPRQQTELAGAGSGVRTLRRERAQHPS